MLIVRHHLPSLRLFPSGWMFDRNLPRNAHTVSLFFLVLFEQRRCPFQDPGHEFKRMEGEKEQPGGFLHSLAFLSPPLHGRREWQLT